jgi:hypothetical protein
MNEGPFSWKSSKGLSGNTLGLGCLTEHSAKSTAQAHGGEVLILADDTTKTLHRSNRNQSPRRQSEEAMPTVEIWIAMSEDGDYEVATDEDTAIERLIDGSGDDLAGTVCRVVKLNVTMSLPHVPDDDESDRPAVDVTVAVPDGAGRIVEAT